MPGPNRTTPGGCIIEAITIFILLGGAYAGWNIGANDTANCIGPTVGCGLLSFKRAVFLVAIFTVLGGLLQGQAVMLTVGNGIVDGRLTYSAVVIALFCAGCTVTMATFFKIPTSTSQAIIGGVIGVGLALDMKIQYAKLYTIAGSWVLCPFLVMSLSFILLYLLHLILHKIRASAMLIQNALGKMAILASCYVAYSLGANHAGSAVGPIANLEIFPPFVLLGMGGISIAFGAVSYGQKVTDTIGKGITPLDVQSAFIALISSAFGVHLFSIWGIPVSTSSAIVGAVVGVGLMNGAKAVSAKTILIILIGWVLTPALSATTAYLIYKTVRMLFA